MALFCLKPKQKQFSTGRVVIGSLSDDKQWGLAKIQPPGSVVNLNISCDIYCISATSIDGDWPYIKLIDNTKFKLVVNAQKSFWICLGIADKQQWGYYKATSSSYTLTFPIAFSSKTCAVCVTNVNSGSGFPVTSNPNTNSIQINNKCYENFWIAAGFQRSGEEALLQR